MSSVKKTWLNLLNSSEKKYSDTLKSILFKIEIIDIRTIFPLDEELVFDTVNKHGKCLVLTEEPYNNSFAQALSARIQKNCFENLDAPVFGMGSENMPAIPLNSTLEHTMPVSYTHLTLPTKA